MGNNLNRFSKEALADYLAPWEQSKEEIGKLYNDRDCNAAAKLQEMIVCYEGLLAYGGNGAHPQSGQQQPILLPLNGEERLAFIKKQIHSHYAFVQLDALFDETKKKAARLAVIKKSVRE